MVTKRKSPKTSTSESAAPEATSWLDDFKKLAEKFRFPGLDVAALIEWQREDFEAMAEANRKAYEDIQLLITRRDKILQDVFKEWFAAMKETSSIDAGAKQAEITRQQVEKAAARFMELSQFEEQVRTNAWKAMQERMQGNFANLQKLLQTSK